MTPALSAELTASPRLLAPNFLKVFRRCVSTEGTARPRSFARRLVVWPFAMPRSTCISLGVRFTKDVDVELGVSATRRKTSGIIRRGTGLSFRIAASNACSNSAGPASFSRYPAQPTRIILSRSSLDSETVQATILRSGNRARTLFAVAGPSIKGMCTSMRTMSGLSLSIIGRAVAPLDASPTKRRSSDAESMARAAVRGTTLSSTTNTRNFR
jgi:hypothetical protein